jgi:hypothetical protein
MIDFKVPVRDTYPRPDLRWPGRLGWLQIVGFGLVLAFPLITMVAGAEIPKPYMFLAPVPGPAAVFLGFICIGAGSRAFGSIRGGLAGVALYLLLGAAICAFWVLRFGPPPPDLVGILYLGLGWPLTGLFLLGLFGG